MSSELQEVMQLAVNEVKGVAFYSSYVNGIVRTIKKRDDLYRVVSLHNSQDLLVNLMTKKQVTMLYKGSIARTDYFKDLNNTCSH
jgi:phosphopantetheine adenylyltransferase